MKFYPRLHQAQLLTRQVTRKNLTVSETNGRLKLGVFGVNVRHFMQSTVGLAMGHRQINLGQQFGIEQSVICGLIVLR